MSHAANLTSPSVLPLARPSWTDALIRAVALAGLAFLLPALVHLLPWGNLGPVLMPLAIPVFLGAFLLPLPLALGAAVVLPVSSFLISGMPPMAPPILPILVAEGLATVLAVRLLNRSTALPLWALVIGGIVANRVVAVVLLMAVLGAGTSAAVAGASLGIVGLSVNLLVLPVLLRFFRDFNEDRAA